MLPISLWSDYAASIVVSAPRMQDRGEHNLRAVIAHHQCCLQPQLPLLDTAHGKAGVQVNTNAEIQPVFLHMYIGDIRHPFLIVGVGALKKSRLDD